MPKINYDLKSAKAHFCPNSAILTKIGGELSYRQSQNGINFDFKFNWILKAKVNHPPKR